MSRGRPQLRVGPEAGRARGGYGRVVLLAILAFLLAVGWHAVLGLAGLRPEHPARVFLTPLVAAMVIVAGMRTVPLGRRLRLAALAAAGLFLYAMVQ